MTATIIDAAHTLLTTHPVVPASVRLAWARQTTNVRRDWADLHFDDNLIAHVERDGFTVHVEYERDPFPDDTWLGTFTDRWEPGAIKHLGAWGGDDYTEPDDLCRWYVPSISAEHVRRDCRKMGYARHAAWLEGQRATRDSYRRTEVIEPYFLSVTVSRDGIALATNELGGVDLGTDLPGTDADEEAALTAVDVIDETLGEAKTALKRLAIGFAKAASL